VNNNPNPPPNRSRFPLWWLWLALLIIAILGLYASTGEGQFQPIPYSQFQKLLDHNQVKQVVVSGKDVRGILKENIPGSKTDHFSTTAVAPNLASELTKHGVEFTGQSSNGGWGAILSWIIPPLIFVAIWFFAMRGFSGGGGGGFGSGLMSIGRSKAKLAAETGIKTTFADVAGVDEAKEELREFVDYLRHPREFGRLGAHVPRGILLIGPPGTGKTLLARAIAGEAGVPFFSTNGAEFVEMFVGVGAARVRDMFAQARKQSPCIIFIDELDALGRARNASPIQGQDEKEQTLNQLLAEMDGFDRTTAIVVLGATNRPEIIDPALLRAGRFDRQVLVDRPDKKGRVDILRIHLEPLTVALDVKLEELAAMTPGFTGADLANLANEAAVVATRRGADAISIQDFTEAVERIVAGLQKRSRILIPKERRIVAYHEMGHALVSLAIPGTDPVEKVSIIPRGVGALGYTMQHPTEDRFLMGRQELLDRLCVLLGGRAAEMLTGEDISTGAADDLTKATDIARGIVLRYGMDKRLGPVAWDTDQGSQFLQQQPGSFWRNRRFSEETAREIDQAVKEYLERALQRAVNILRGNRSALEEGAAALLAHETLAGSEIPRPKPVALVAE
jgi:cell division protease FtsH